MTNSRITPETRCIAARLCLDFARNLAGYRAGQGSARIPGKNSPEYELWATLTGNFIDIAILDWSKLFKKRYQEKYSWEKVVSDPASFQYKLLLHLEITKSEWDNRARCVFAYRDDSVAHRGLREKIIVPDMCMPWRAVTFLYDTLKYEAQNDAGYRLKILENDIRTYYDWFVKEAVKVYAPLAQV